MKKVTLKRLLDASDREHIEGFAVEAYHYPTDITSTIELVFDDCRVELPVMQEVELRAGGIATALDIDGEPIEIHFVVVRPLTMADLK